MADAQIGTEQTQLALDINNGFLSVLNASCSTCASVGMDASYNTVAQPSYYEPYPSPSGSFKITGQNAEGYEGTVWLGEDTISIKPAYVSADNNNTAIVNTNTGKNVANPASFVVV